VKTNLFQYVRAETIAEAVALRHHLGDGASFLAGGQSLVPTMALRMAAPEVLIDISAVGELQQISVQDGTLHIGAGCRYADVLASSLVAGAAPLLARAIPFIAHEAIRNRGTIGGSLAHADPASEMPACMMALDAQIVLRSPGGERRVPAAAFFPGTYLTAMDEGELLVGVDIPLAAPGVKQRFLEISRRAGDYAITGGAFVLEFDRNVVRSARLAFFSVSDRPLLAKAAAAALCGQPLSATSIEEASAIVAKEIEFFADLYTGVDAKQHITRTLTQRLLEQFKELE